jgi:predicted NAD/FAD-binding protein
MDKKRIAIIGAGGSGLIAAWSLKDKYDVCLFEAEEHIGGHAYSHPLSDGKKEINIDMGVEYYNEKLSPNVCAILDVFNVESYIAPLTFRAIFDNEDNSYWSNVSIEGNLKAVLNDDFERFHKDIDKIIQSEDPKYKELSIGDFLSQNGYSEAFQYQAIYPLMTIYLGCNTPAMDYNLMYVAYSFHMNLLSLFSAGYWKKAKDGIYSYIKKVGETLKDNIILNANIDNIAIIDNKIKIHYNNNPPEYFDHLIFATQVDIALKYIESSNPFYEEYLGCFDYAPVNSYLHQDKKIIDTNTKEYFEFRMSNKFDLEDKKHESGQLTRIYNNLFQYKNFEETALVTFDPKSSIESTLIKKQKKWKLGKLRPKDFKRRQRIRNVQGINNIWFCGTDTSLTGHEGAVVSGLVLAEQFGIEYPFPDNKLALNQFNIIKSFMGF